MPDLLTSPIQHAFAHELRATRHEAVRVAKARKKERLTQTAMAAALQEMQTEVAVISKQMVSFWENGRNGIPHYYRNLLTGIVAVLYQHGGIDSLDKANALLTAGRYDRLSRDEIARVEMAWLPDADYLWADSAENPLPPPPYAIGFTSQTAKLLYHLTRKDSTNVHVISGLGGSGKTTLAMLLIHLLYRCDPTMPIKWLTVPHELTPAEQVLQIVRQLWQGQHGIGSDGQPLNIIQAQLAQQLHTQKGIIVIDGVMTLESYLAFCELLHPLKTSVKFLLTARETDADSTVKLHQIESLSGDDAATLLQHHLGNVTVDAQIANDLLGAIGGHPLAIREVATQLKVGLDVTISNDNLLPETLYTAIFANLWETLTLPQRTVLLCFYLFPTAGAAFAPLADITQLDNGLYDVTTELSERGLLMATVGSGRYQLQPMVYQYLSRLIGGQIHYQRLVAKRCGYALHYWLHKVRNTAHDQLSKLDDSRTAIWRTVRVALDFQGMLSAENIQTLTDLTRKLTDYVYIRGYAYEWLPLLTQLLQQLRQLDNTTRVYLLSNLGVVARYAARIETAMAAHQRGLILAQQLDLADAIAAAQYNIGVCHELFGEWDQSSNYAYNALNGFQKQEDGNGIAATHNLLGMIHFRQGNFVEAEKQFQTAIDTFELANKRAEMVRSYYNLARIYVEQRDFKRARARFRNVDTALRHNPNRLVEMYGVVYQADMYNQDGKHSEAYKYLSRWTETDVIVLGHAHLYAGYLNQFGWAATALGHDDKGLDRLRRSVEIWHSLNLPVQEAAVVLNLLRWAMLWADSAEITRYSNEIDKLLKDNQHYYLARKIIAQRDDLHS